MKEIFRISTEIYETETEREIYITYTIEMMLASYVYSRDKDWHDNLLQKHKSEDSSETSFWNKVKVTTNKQTKKCRNRVLL